MLSTQIIQRAGVSIIVTLLLNVGLSIKLTWKITNLRYFFLNPEFLYCEKEQVGAE